MPPGLVTPNKPNEAAEIVQEYNKRYGLKIKVPDIKLTPSRRKQLSELSPEFARSDRICRAFGFLYYNGDLEQVDDAFYLESLAAAQAWIPTPNTDPPKARTEGQRVQLEKILARLLDDAQQLAKPIPLKTFPSHLVSEAPEQTVSYPVLPSPETLNLISKRSKRSSPDGRQEVQKRVKGPVPLDDDFDALDDQTPFFDAIDDVDHVSLVRPRETSPTPLFRSVHDRSRASVAGSSKWSLAQSIFTEAESADTALTQSTVELTSQERRKLPIRDVTRSDDAYGVTSSDRHFLDEEAFCRHEAQQPSTQEQVLPKLNDCVPSSPAVSTPYSSCSGFADLVIPDIQLVETAIEPLEPLEPLEPAADSNDVLKGALNNIWPKFPPCLRDAPFPIAWEITRICHHCGVDPETLPQRYNPEWNSADVTKLWKCLRRLDIFRGKTFPEAPIAEAWTAAFTNFQSRGRAVVSSVVLDFNKESPPGRLFAVTMKPFTLDSSSRLTRRFGPDRFLEIIMPALSDNLAKDKAMKAINAHAILGWLIRPHRLVGRLWTAFYTVDLGFKKLSRDVSLELEAPKRGLFRIYLFAEDGPGFRSPQDGSVPPANEPIGKRSKCTVSGMLDWLLQVSKNHNQPYLKLFSRIQLGLTRTYPILELEPGQIRHRNEDIKSPIAEVMNDGIGLMSRSVARKVSQVLGLSDIPSAVQGRIGPAKGMWLMDITDVGDEDWIETFPSQRKWEYDMTSADPYQRTLEVKAYAKSVLSAALNLQLLPVLEDRGDPRVMRNAIRTRILDGLKEEFDKQKVALTHPVLFKQYIHERRRPSRLDTGIPLLGGLPDNKHEALSFLLDSGFNPTEQKYLQDLAFTLQKQHCDTLKSKMKIPVGRSAYMYMVVDFWGLLEENEVHVSFSDKFQDQASGFSDTSLEDMDILVARSPAHFPSDIQRVRAVYKSELRPLKDVIVFSMKGNIPLAKKLSGGDYDGDKAWVCWDPDIVCSFVNADMPQEPDLAQYVKKDKTTFGDLARQIQGRDQQARSIMQMVEKGFEFNLRGNFLGIATNYKERYCYHTGSVSSAKAILLSSLVGNLVDQTKQGILFGHKEWEQLRQKYFGNAYLEDPAYKLDVWTRTEDDPSRVHIIDYLKFYVARPAIEKELEILHKTMAPNSSKNRISVDSDTGAQWWDADLAQPFQAFQELGQKSKTCKGLLAGLRNDLEKVYAEWKDSVRNDTIDYRAKVTRVYERFCAVQPLALPDLFKDARAPSADTILEESPAPPHTARVVGDKVESKMAVYMREDWLPDPENSRWSLLRASTAFKLYHWKSPSFVWQIAGRQLATIKALMVARRGELFPAVAPSMYVAMMPDKKYAKQLAAREDGDGGSEWTYAMDMEGDDKKIIGNGADDDDDDDDDNDVWFDASDGSS